MPGPEPSAASDNLLWPIDRVLLLGFAPAGLATAATLIVLGLLEGTCPDAHEALVTALFVGQAALWLVFAPVYLVGWVHWHPAAPSPRPAGSAPPPSPRSSGCSTSWCSPP
ncbi:hypothetical protein [Nannocystis pusilla]|uniref:hypothetical protein n=1 Tax=Nannocystis pusilla TaxID=889268 RepID=UPI003B81C8AC